MELATRPLIAICATGSVNLDKIIEHCISKGVKLPPGNSHLPFRSENFGTGARIDSSKNNQCYVLNSSSGL